MEHNMLNELIDGILQVLQGQALRIVLYGSAARGTATPESDIDIAVFVHQRLDAEKDALLSDVVVEMNLKYNKVFSVIDIDETVYQKWRKVTPFYQNVDKDGIILWTAA